MPVIGAACSHTVTLIVLHFDPLKHILLQQTKYMHLVGIECPAFSTASRDAHHGLGIILVLQPEYLIHMFSSDLTMYTEVGTTDEEYLKIWLKWFLLILDLLGEIYVLH